MKVATIIGTRPEIIRLSRVIDAFDHHFNHILIHTGQNYDYELNEIFFEDLGIRKPDYFLNAAGETAAETAGHVIAKSDKVLRKICPEAVLILGDTNSCLAAYSANRLKIPVFHMEAGNRCFDLNVPEEINRKIIDHISDFNLVYTEHARRNLLREGIHPRKIYLTGSPMKEILMYYRNKINNSKILAKLLLKKEKYFLVSIHREENVDNKENLLNIIDILNKLSGNYHLPVIVSTHPRTKNRMQKVKNIKKSNLIRFLKPFGFTNYIHLQMNAFCTLSDSGTISEESAILSFPAITIRNAMERMEAMDSGSIIMTGLDINTIIESIKIATADRKNLSENTIPDEYKIANTSQRIVKLIIGTSKLIHKWDGIIKNDL